MSRMRRLPVRWRLAGISAGLTFVILLLFAMVVGVFTARQVYGSFNNDLRSSVVDLSAQLSHPGGIDSLRDEFAQSDPVLRAAASGQATAGIVDANGNVYAGSGLGSPAPGLHDVSGYRVATQPLTRFPVQLFVEYARPLAEVHHTIDRMRFFLIFGVLAGTGLALLAGLMLARGAMAPIASLTRAAREIARTRDPAVRLPQPPAEDEVADLARTLEQMLAALDEARGETQSALDRQREFIADASHELRTPLTSILANLELLEAELQGEDAEIAGAALRSSRRMRRLVGDLLLLARADAGRPSAREPVDLGAVAREAAGEAMPMATSHELTLEVEDESGALVLDGSPDELHRLVLNLIQNALMHTPPGTAIAVGVRRKADSLVVEVSDDGPGIPPELRPRIFERFVRGTGDRASGGSGLGLSIVRAVAESNGGTVELSDSDSGGARFTVRLPSGALSFSDEQPRAAAQS